MTLINLKQEHLSSLLSSPINLTMWQNKVVIKLKDWMIYHVYIFWMLNKWLKLKDKGETMREY